MLRSHAVPVWTKVGHTPEMTGLKTVTEEERADGILRLEPEALVLEVEIVASTTTVGGTGTTTDTETVGTRAFEIPFDQIMSSTMGRWPWSPITLQVDRLQVFEGLPGAKRGRASLRVSFRNRAAARALVTELELARAELDYRRAEALAAGEIERLAPREPEGRGA